MTLLDRDREKREEGFKEGRLQEKIEIAKNLLDVLPVEIIAQKTGLSVDEINKLK
jgi:predicted transposase/invertase (TIGR01784 family)